MLTGKQFGRYEVQSKIGEGGMGQVYAALDAELGRRAAIKLLPSEFTTDPDRRNRFRQEARVISALNHPNIITIYEIGENEHGSFLATEYVEGRTLCEVIKQESLTLPRILRIIEQAANALVAAHAAHIIHRDIKPENIMIRLDSIVKVLDFGLAKPNEQIIKDSNSENSKTIPGTVMGSARYMSPEQARGQEVDERTDIWSLGIVLYEMLTGHAPFDRETSADTLAAVIYQEPEPIGQVLPNAPIELQRILRKALQKDREERYQSMKDFALDIKDLTYEIEHSNSGGRSGHVVSSPEFSENRTVIHRTISSNHPTDQTNVYTSGPSTVLPRRPRARTVGIGIAAAFLLLAVMGFGIYGWFYSGQSLSASAFEKTQISRINTDGRVRLPAISPDGRYVAYVSGEVGNRSIAVRQISTESEIPVVPASALGFATLAFSPSGDYVYYTQTSADYSLNTLYQVPTFGGPSKKIITDVDSAPTFSPDGKRLAFLRHVSERGDDVIFVANLDGSNIQPLVSRRDATKYDFLTAPAWSPDGSKVLFGAGRINGGVVVDVVIAEASTGDGSFRIFNPKKWNNVESLVWFRDGSGFLLTARDSDAAPMQVWRVAYPSGAIEAVTNDLNNYSGLALSSDGATIITAKADLVSSVWNYSPTTKEFNQLMADSSKLEGGSGITQAPDGRLIFSSDEGFEKNLWISDRDGKNALRLTSGAKINQTPLVTPDGRYIVFNSSRSGTFRVWRMDLDGKNPVQLTEETAEASDFNPVITPDGKSILFNRNYLTDNRVSAIMRVPVEGGASTSVLSDSQHANFSPVISPDGKHLAFMSYDTSTYLRKILVATFDGNVTGAIESSFVSNLMSNLKWSPDGKSLVYITGQGIPNLWKLSVDGTKPQPLTDFRSGRIFNYAWSRDGKNLLIIRGIVNNDLILIRDAARTTAQLSNPYNASRV